MKKCHEREIAVF